MRHWLGRRFDAVSLAFAHIADRLHGFESVDKRQYDMPPEVLLHALEEAQARWDRMRAEA